MNHKTPPWGSLMPPACAGEVMTEGSCLGTSRCVGTQVDATHFVGSLEGSTRSDEM